MRNLVVANAHIWAAPLPRVRQKDMLVSTFAFGGAWVVVLLGAALVGHLDQIAVFGLLLSLLAQSLLSAAGWLFVTLRLPDRRRTWTDLVPGSLLFGFGLALMHLVSRVYLPARFEHSARLYGAIGIAATVLVWLLVLGQLVLASALLNRVWSGLPGPLGRAPRPG